MRSIVLIMAGAQTHFHFATHDKSDNTLRRWLKRTPRPIVAVPETPSKGEVILVAYDGSLPSSRALYVLVASGLTEGRQVHVECVRPEKLEASVCADRAAEFLLRSPRRRRAAAARSPAARAWGDS